MSRSYAPVTFAFKNEHPTVTPSDTVRCSSEVLLPFVSTLWKVACPPSSSRYSNFAELSDSGIQGDLLLHGSGPSQSREWKSVPGARNGTLGGQGRAIGKSLAARKVMLRWGAG